MQKHGTFFVIDPSLPIVYIYTQTGVRRRMTTSKAITSSPSAAAAAAAAGECHDKYSSKGSCRSRTLLIQLMLPCLLFSRQTFATAAFITPSASTPSRSSLVRRYSSASGTSTTSSNSAPSSWARLSQLVEAALLDDGDFTKDGIVDNNKQQQKVPAQYMSIGASLADTHLVEALEGMKVKRRKDGTVEETSGRILKFFQSVRLEPYRVSFSDVRVYARMQDKLEKTLGFTASPAVERIESGIALVMAASVMSSITVLDKLPGPDIIRWFATAALVSLPFAYISLGLSFPETLVASVNQVLFAFNKEYKERLYRHEAGHFLVGYLVGLPVLKYSVSGRLNAVQFAQILSFGRKQAKGLDMDAPENRDMGPASLADIEKLTPRGLLTNDELAKLTVVSLAGVVSEFVRFGNAEGGFNDLAQLQALFDLADPDMSDRKSEELINWGTLASYNMIKSNEKALVALMKAFERKASVIECIKIIEQEGGQYLTREDDD